MSRNRCPSCGGHLVLSGKPLEKLSGKCQACHAEITVTGASTEVQQAALPKATSGITIRDRSKERPREKQSPPKGKSEPVNGMASLNIVRQAMTEKKLLSFSYRDSKGVMTQRTVEPYKLSQKNGFIVLYGYCIEKEGIRSFNFISMSDLSLQAYSFEPRWEIEDNIKK